MSDTPIEKEWRLRAPGAMPTSSILGALHPVVGRIVAARDIASAEDLDRFLVPRLAHLDPPGEMCGIADAILRLEQARAGAERVVVYGDYDVDGITGAAVLVSVLGDLGLNVTFYVPDRMREGYGLQASAVRTLAEQGTQLIVTVDCGISSVAEVALATELGVDTIVIDHHRVPRTLPAAAAVINPRREDCPFPYKHLAAVGVAFYLCAALRTALRKIGVAAAEHLDLNRYLDFVAMGTIADMVPLTGDNRILAATGLGVLARTEHIGLRALMEVSRVDPLRVSSQDVAYRLGPRINAVGRVHHASAGVELLLTRDDATAVSLARELALSNDQRRTIEDRIREEGERLAEAVIAQRDPPVLVLYDERWHPGVVGIVASRLVERFNRPAVVVGAHGKGSARSVPGVHIFRAIETCEHLLQRFGGHAQAAGITVAPEDIEALREALELAVTQQAGGAVEPPSLLIDTEVELHEIDHRLAQDLIRLGPYGVEHPEPLLLLRGVQVRSQRVVGLKHLKLVVGDGTRWLSAIGFGMEPTTTTEAVDLVCTPEMNFFRGSEELQLRLAAPPRPALGTYRPM